MYSTFLGLVATVLAAPAPAAATRPVGGDDPIVYQGRAKLPAEELPESLPQGARTAISTWAPWAAEFEYRMDLSADGRVLLLSIDTKKGAKGAKKNMVLIEDILDATDGIMPLPDSREAVAASDDEDDDGTYEWGARPRETQTAVLLEMDNEDHHGAAVAHLVELNPYLAAWGRAAAGMSGFVLESPLVAAWQPYIGIKEDYEGSPKAEMINRLAQMLTLRRFGQQPYWLAMGLAWHTEMEENKGIYCFPYRSGFVSSAEHENWNKLLENSLRRRKEALTMRELAALKRGHWDTDGAHLAWGTVAFLVRFHPDALPEILDELYTLWDEQGRTENEDGNWERIPGFEPDLDAQLEVFQKHVPDFLDQLLRFFAKGKLYKP